MVRLPFVVEVGGRIDLDSTFGEVMLPNFLGVASVAHAGDHDNGVALQAAPFHFVLDGFALFDGVIHRVRGLDDGVAEFQCRILESRVIFFQRFPAKTLFFEVCVGEGILAVAVHNSSFGTRLENVEGGNPIAVGCHR